MSQTKDCKFCKKKIDILSFNCTYCLKIQDPFEINPFDLFKLERKFEVNLEKLEDKYIDLQSTLHPDKFVQSPDEQKKLAGIHSSFVNDSYNLIKDTTSRIKILLDLNGFVAPNEKSFNDITMLEEIMIIQNKCMSVENEKEKKKIKEELKLQINKEKDKISKYFKFKELKSVYKSSVKLSYLEKINNNLK